MLDRSVITSSSSLPLAKFFSELSESAPGVFCDVYLFREVDYRSIRELMEIFGRRKKPSSARLMSDPALVERFIKPYIESAIPPVADGPRPICALATHFSSISSLIGANQLARANEAEAAIRNSVELACDLVKSDRMSKAIVEIVCGDLVETDHRALPERRIATPVGEWTVAEAIAVDRDLKIEKLMLRLVRIVEEINRDEDWCLALELEPGDVFVFNGLKSLKTFGRLIEEPRFEALKGRVGFNMDVAHMNISDVRDSDLQEVSHLLVHAHQCDTPGQHTRDLPVGVWDAVVPQSNRSRPYLEVLNAVDPSSSDRCGLPFSRAVALELEGCRQWNWILEGLSAMHYQFKQLDRSSVGNGLRVHEPHPQPGPGQLDQQEGRPVRGTGAADEV
ncbi:MAG: hypothetical protein AAFX06_26845 [Planctomycetota bacterium]